MAHRGAVIVGEAAEDRIVAAITSRTLATTTASSPHTAPRTRRLTPVRLLPSPAIRSRRSNSGTRSMGNSTPNKPRHPLLYPRRITTQTMPLRCISNSLPIAVSRHTHHNRRTARAIRHLARNPDRQPSSGVDIHSLRARGHTVEADEVGAAVTTIGADLKAN